MTIYVGELVRLTATAKSFSSASVSPDDIDSMNVSIYNADLEEVLSEREMTWQPDEELWYYLWMTTEDEHMTRAGPPDPGRRGVPESQKWGTP